MPSIVNLRFETTGVRLAVVWTLAVVYAAFFLFRFKFRNLDLESIPDFGIRFGKLQCLGECDISLDHLYKWTLRVVERWMLSATPG